MERSSPEGGRRHHRFPFQEATPGRSHLLLGSRGVCVEGSSASLSQLCLPPRSLEKPEPWDLPKVSQGHYLPCSQDKIPLVSETET